jgi:hypothetical protein
MLFYYFLPFICSGMMPTNLILLFASFIVGSRLCYSDNCRANCDIIEMCFNYFYRTLCRHFPKQFSTLPAHLLIHLPKQLERHGALPYASMFAFEGGFHVMKNMVHGTRGQLNQLAQKVILRKILREFLIHNKKHGNSTIKRLIHNCDLHVCSKADINLINNETLLMEIFTKLLIVRKKAIVRVV